MGSLLVTCLLYLGVSIAFYERTAHKAYVAFYVIAVVEVLVNLAVAFWWKPMTFEKTHLVERMTCLTLIIVCISFAKMWEAKANIKIAW